MDRSKHQELFNTIAKHLIEQGEPAQEASGACQYRLERDGKVLKCAVGWLIPDELYVPEMENEGDIYAILSKYDVLDPILGEFDSELLKLYQAVHDLFDYPEVYYRLPGTPLETMGTSWLQEWAHDMRRIAKFYDLDAGVLDSVSEA